MVTNPSRAILECDAILFDMDGTLIDSTPVVIRHWTAWANRYGLDPAEILAVSHGMLTQDTIRKFVPRVLEGTGVSLDPEEEAQRILREEEEDSEGTTVVNGALELLVSLPPERWAVVTSAPRSMARKRFDYCGLPQPGVLISAEDVRTGKPDPEGYLAAAAALGFAPANCVVFEDSHAGLAAGRACGAKTVAISTTYPCIELDAEVCLPHFADLSLEQRFDGMMPPGRLRIRQNHQHE